MGFDPGPSGSEDRAPGMLSRGEQGILWEWGAGARWVLHLGSRLCRVFCKRTRPRGRMVMGLWWAQREGRLLSSRRLEVGTAGLVASWASGERGPGVCHIAGVLMGAASSSCLATRDAGSAAAGCFCRMNTKPTAAFCLPPGPHRVSQSRDGSTGWAEGGQAGQLTPHHSWPCSPALPAPGSEEGLPGHVQVAPELAQDPRLLGSGSAGPAVPKR